MSQTNDQDLIILSDDSLSSELNLSPIIDSNEGLSNNNDLISFDDSNLMQNSSVTNVPLMETVSVPSTPVLEDVKPLSNDLDLAFGLEEKTETPVVETAVADLSSNDLFGNFGLSEQEVTSEEKSNNLVETPAIAFELPKVEELLTISEEKSEEVISNDEDMNTILSSTIAKLKLRQENIVIKRGQKVAQIDDLESQIKKLKESVSLLKGEVSLLDLETAKIDLNVTSLESMKVGNEKTTKLPREHNTKKLITAV